jgi:Flp pilus assembly protein TadG
MLPTATTRRKRQSGQVLLDAAFTVVITFSVVFWVFEVALAMYTYTVMGNAANEGVRYAVVHNMSSDAATIDKVKAFAATSLHDTSAISVTVNDPDGDYNPQHRVTVTVTYTYVPWLRGYIQPPTMTTFAEGRMVVCQNNC